MNCFFPVTAGSSVLSPLHQGSPHPYCPRKADAMTVHSGTPVPPRYLMRGYGTAAAPSMFATDKGIPASLSQQYTGAAPSSNGVHTQQGPLARANNGNQFNAVSQNAQYQPHYQSPGEHDILYMSFFSPHHFNMCRMQNVVSNTTFYNVKFYSVFFLKFGSATIQTLWHHIWQVVGLRWGHSLLKIITRSVN